MEKSYSAIIYQKAYIWIDHYEVKAKNVAEARQKIALEIQKRDKE